ncbi:MAG TPA: CBS domain-containing protein [Candidatus Solibacter sp.]|jgi:magnesium transporter|nr:CBS domain-containing protein [Candidatus Solibacter sp.]
MIFLSDFLRAEIVDNQQRRIGRVGDLVAHIAEPFPIVHHVILRGKGGRSIPWSEVRTFEAKELALKSSRDDLQFGEATDNDIWLARDVLDKQIVDTDGRRVVRVNDLQLSPMRGNLLVVGVDVGGRGLLRRMGAEDLGKGLAHLARRDWAQKLIAWDAVDPIHSDLESVKLRIAHQKVAKMHPADIADIVDHLSPRQRDAIFASLADDVAADVVEEMDPEDQVDVIEGLDDERAADILEEMDPDEAADLIADLPEARAEILLDKMDEEDAEDVEELLAYEEDTAGGLMTTEYVAISSDLTAGEAIDRLRELEPEAEQVYYVYVVDHREDLLGVLSLRDLIVAKPDTPITAIMIRSVVKVPLSASHGEVAEVIRKYNLLAVPVVDVDGHLEGIVTVDDVMEEVLSRASKRRLPRLFG